MFEATRLNKEDKTENTSAELLEDRNAVTDETGEAIDRIWRLERAVKRYQWLVIKIVAVLAIIWLLFFQILGLTHMPNEDMFPRIDAGDLILFYRLDTDVTASDVIVLEKETPDSDGQKQMFISRVVAKSGDTVDIVDGSLIVNGNSMWENKIFYPTVEFSGVDVKFPLKLAEGECFVLADRRDTGADSRYFGPVKQDEIKGTVITVLRRTDI